MGVERKERKIKGGRMWKREDINRKSAMEECKEDLYEGETDGIGTVDEEK